MNWELMTKIAMLHNQNKTAECAELIADNLIAIDNEQSFDFIITCLSLSDLAYNLCPEVYKKIYEFLKTKMPSNNLKSALRIARLQQLVEKQS
jgi:hypothetical protein